MRNINLIYLFKVKRKTKIAEGFLITSFELTPCVRDILITEKGQETCNSLIKKKNRESHLVQYN